MKINLIIYCICIVLTAIIFYKWGYNSGSILSKDYTVTEDRHSAVFALTPELFTGYKDGDYIVCHPDMGNGKSLTLLFTFNHKEYDFQKKKTFKYPQMMLFNYILSEEEIEQLAGVKMEISAGKVMEN